MNKGKCPVCNGKAVKYVEDGFLISSCRSKKDCNFYNKVKLESETKLKEKKTNG